MHLAHWLRLNNIPKKCGRSKAEFTEIGIFFLLQLFARDILSMKEVEIEETKTT